jgi:PAS domain-containing protein
LASASAVPAGDHAQAPAPAVAVPLRRYERERAARKQAEQLLTDKSQALFDALQSSRDAERRLQLALWASGEGIWEWRSEDGLLRAQGLLVAGQPVASPPLSMESLLQRVHAEDRAALSIAWQLHVGGSRPDIDTACRIRVGGSMRWLRLRGRALQRDGSGRPAAIYGTVKDVTDQRDAEHALHLLAQAFASTLDALVVVDDRWQIVQANESFRALAGSTEAAGGLDRAPAAGHRWPRCAVGG